MRSLTIRAAVLLVAGFVVLATACSSPKPDPCGSGRSSCDGTCVDLQSDAKHCGSCSKACAGSEICVAGACTCDGAGRVCDGVCVDNLSNDAHCGACDKPCALPTHCGSGACICLEGDAFTPCGKACVDTTQDPTHCGACGNDCGTGHDCVASKCQ
jgi:hypothetical protein